jgi:hypothetical protein
LIQLNDLRFICLTLFAMPLLASHASAEEKSAKECLADVVKFEAFARKELPKKVESYELRSAEDFLEKTVNDMRLLCAKRDMDGARDRGLCGDQRDPIRLMRGGR